MSGILGARFFPLFDVPKCHACAGPIGDDEARCTQNVDQFGEIVAGGGQRIVLVHKCCCDHCAKWAEREAAS